MRAPAALRPLRSRNFALLWGGSLVSVAGSWLQTVAVGALVTEATHQAKWTALVAVAAFLPIGLLSPIGGALADRIDRRRFLMAGNAFEGAVAAVLAVLAATDRASPGVVTGIVFLAGCSTALRIPFQQSVIPDTVPPEDLLAAVSLGSAGFNMGRVVGPALAGLLIAIGSFAWAFAVNAVSFVAVIVSLSLIVLPNRRAPAGEGILTSIKDGARAARSEPACRTAILLISVVAFLVSPFISLIPAVALELTDGSEQAVGAATGALTTAQGIGAVIGAFAIVPLALRLGRRRMIVGAIVGSSLALCAYAFAPRLWLAVVCLGFVGLAYIGVLSGLNTVVQLRAPAAFRGRVLSLYLVALGVIYPLGSLAQGLVADRIGLSETTALFALVLVAVVAGIGVFRPAVLAALDDPPRPSATEDEPVEPADPAGAIDVNAPVPELA